MIKYKKYQNKNEKLESAYGKWFARPVHELMEFDEFISHLATHHCSFSEGTIRGVIVEMENCLREMLLDGKAVRFDELGIFRLGISTEGEADKKDLTASSIKAVRLNLYLGKRFRAADLFRDARFKEADIYTAGFELPDDGEDPVSEGGNSGGSGNGSGNTNTDPNTPTEDIPGEDRP